MPAKPPFRTLVVNTIGEPGCGKTTLSFWLCQALKHAGIVVEFAPEVIKYECFTPQGRARVASGQFDQRYLTQQARLLRAVLGQVEVLVNDGPFEVFSFYARRRMDPISFEVFQSCVLERIHSRNSDPGAGLSMFVAPVRHGAYEHHGRIEDAAQAAAIRSDLFDYLQATFSVSVCEIPDVASRDKLLANIIDLAHARRIADTVE
jgi:hypothetical protein